MMQMIMLTLMHLGQVAMQMHRQPACLRSSLKPKYRLHLREDGSGGLLCVRLLAARQPVQRVVQLPAPQILQHQHLSEWRHMFSCSTLWISTPGHNCQHQQTYTRCGSTQGSA